MKICYLAIIFAFVLCPFDLFAKDVNPVLSQVTNALEPVLKKLDPNPKISYANNGTTLVVCYLSQSYKIHNRSMTGEVSEVTRDEIGPSFKGFVLKVHLQDKGEVNQAVTPQTLREPYWQTDLDVTPVGKTKNQIYWGLSYGSRTDAKMLFVIREILHNLKH